MEIQDIINKLAVIEAGISPDGCGIATITIWADGKSHLSTLDMNERKLRSFDDAKALDDFIAAE